MTIKSTLFHVFLLVILNILYGGMLFAAYGENDPASDSLEKEAQEVYAQWINSREYKREQEFNEKSFEFIRRRFGVPLEFVQCDPRFQTLEYDESYPDCDYFSVKCDGRINGIGGAVGPYFANIKKVIKTLSKVGRYEVTLEVDTSGYVSSARITKDTFNNDEVGALILRAFSGMFFNPLRDTLPATVVIAVVASVKK